MHLIRIINKLKHILSNHQKLRIFELTVLMILGGFLETCSVSLILPFMESVMNPEETMEKWYVKIICGILRIQSPEIFLAVLAVLLAGLYIFKNVYLMFEYNIQYRFVYSNMFSLQKRLLATFVSRPYEYFLKVSSGEIIRVINNDTSNAFNLLITLLTLLTELAVSSMLIVAIFFIAPGVTICISIVLALLLIIIYLVIKPVLRKAGLNQQRASAGMNKWLLQSIQGIKDLKVMQKEAFFCNNYDKYGQVFVQSLRKNQTLSLVPRFMIEGVCMGVMFIVVAWLIYRGIQLEFIIPMLTVVAMAAIRLLPSINRISVALTSIAYGEPMLDKVIENLQELTRNSDDTINGSHIEKQSENNFETLSKEIVLRNISYSYQDAKNNILTNANMIIRKGESVGIIGVSGAGKTTTIDIILGLLSPQCGGVFVDGNNISINKSEWLHQIGYIPQMIFMLDDTIKANIAFGEEEKDIVEDNVWNALNEASLEEYVRSLPDGIYTEIGERGIRLSGGQRQRIGIARALYRNTEILIFDEATSALDNETESEIMKSIKGLHGKKTMIIIAHRLSTIETCDHIYKVENEKIIQER